MLDLVFRATLMIGFILLIIFQLKQIKTIVIFHRLSKNMMIPILIILLVFGTMAYTLGETLVDYVFFLVPALSLILSLFNKGLTEKTVIPHTPGTALRNMYPSSFPFEETEDWLVMEQKRRLKVRFTSRYKGAHPTVYYIYFDKNQLEDIQAYLLTHRLSLDKQN